MDQENGPTPGLFSHTATAVPIPTAGPGEAKAQRPVFSSAPIAPPVAPGEGDR